ncbi:MAG: nucleoside 2-deoxyribosyltransferase [Candidatus Bathyarchaeia archaeon]|nr:nucleoside 2-deoxyribosyltransferase [Candidatus Bathyarchaeota archaeon]
MARRVFISGPIQGVEQKQTYREKISALLIQYGYEPVDPWQREKVLYRGPPEGWWERVPPRDFIKRDLEDIEGCDALIAYLPKLSAGTCMEIFYAKIKGKKTIVICRLKNPSPWIIEHADILIKNLRDLKEVLKKGI